MHTQYAKIMIIIACALMFYYVIQRFFTIFNSNNHKWIALLIATIIAGISWLSILYSWWNKFIDIMWTISSRIFVLWFLLFIFFIIENIISTRYKINPRIILSIIIITLWLWIFFSLKTKITNLEIQSDKITKDTKILLISDIHVDHILSTFHIKKIQKAIKKYDVDFVLIAWDLLNKPNPDYVASYSILSWNDYPPILAIVWNHDSMRDTEIVQRISDISNVKILNNETININWIQIVWIIDKSIWWNRSLNDNMDSTKIDTENNLFTILLIHQPISLEKLQDYPIDLEVAGHTHRWQFYWMRKVVEWANDYTYWEYKLWEKTAFVTQWIGTWWLPFRLWTQSEMVIINLNKTK